eukprot:10866963-Alexandrium_andersonii.AAC.1
MYLAALVWPSPQITQQATTIRHPRKRTTPTRSKYLGGPPSGMAINLRAANRHAQAAKATTGSLA